MRAITIITAAIAAMVSHPAVAWGDKGHEIIAAIARDRLTNELVAPIHPKAIVTILAPEDHDRWLSGSYADAVALQRPFLASRMVVRGPVFPTRAARA
jgi:putative SOS response-associated peptidase YedK